MTSNQILKPCTPPLLFQHLLILEPRHAWLSTQVNLTQLYVFCHNWYMPDSWLENFWEQQDDKSWNFPTGKGEGNKAQTWRRAKELKYNWTTFYKHRSHYRAEVISGGGVGRWEGVREKTQPFGGRAGRHHRDELQEAEELVQERLLGSEVSTLWKPQKSHEW